MCFRVRCRAAFFSFFFFFIPFLVFAGEPTEQLKKATDKVVAILGDLNLGSEEKADQKRMLIRSAIDEVFDWSLISQRALGTYWKEREDKEKEEFVLLFGKLLERTYLTKLGTYQGIKIEFLDEKVIDRKDRKYAAIMTRVITEGGSDIKVDYRLRLIGDKWMVYDVFVEGVSLVNNYSIQFRDIINKSSYEELVKKLKENIAKGDAEA
jgi:phospholipid transport system substrate-binding protein